MTEGDFIPQPFSLALAAEICLEPFLARAQAAEAARLAQAQARAARSAGVCWSGLAEAAPPARQRGAEQVHAAAEAALRRAAAFAQTPRGRFLAGLRRLEELGHAAAAEAARAAFARGFADPQRPPCLAEVGEALRALGRLDSTAARGPCLALAELLSESFALAAE